jgi:hypothetical protein
MENLRRQGLIWVLVCAAISAAWGTWITSNGCAWIDFRTVYAGARCLIQQNNPYNTGVVEREYQAEDGQRPKVASRADERVALQVNLPATYVLLTPFAVLSWNPALILWMLLTCGVFIFAILLMWDAGTKYSPQVATFLACMIAINCESIFVGGNTAGLVVGLCGIAVWCFLQDRFVWAGVLCLALSLAVKPHDAGLIWLYFLLAGGVHRKRALQSLVITATISLVSVLWVWHVAPTWMHDWNANLAAISAAGGINDSGPTWIKDALFSIVDLQAAISIFRNVPRFYNLVSYLICGALLLLWSIWTIRTRFSTSRAWLALAAAVPLALLINYHRLWDAKLAMIAIPACCLLWAEGGAIGKAAVIITSIGVLFTGEIILVTYGMTFGSLHLSTNGLLSHLLSVFLTRPATLALLAMGIFYLYIYIKRGARERKSAMDAELTGVPS